MASILDSIFSQPDAVPTMDTVDVTGAMKRGATAAQDVNADALKAYQGYSADTVAFMQKLLNSSNPNISKALDTNYKLGTDLATTGTTGATRSALDYYRRVGLESAAATGAPVSSQFSQNYGGSFGATQILNNQLQGSNILANNANQNLAVFNAELSPANAALSRNLASADSWAASSLTGEFRNNDITNQNKLIDYANDQSMSWFDTLLSQTAKSFISTPFTTLQNMNSVAATMPQRFADTAQSYFGGSPGVGGSGGGGGMGSMFLV